MVTVNGILGVPLAACGVYLAAVLGAVAGWRLARTDHPGTAGFFLVVPLWGASAAAAILLSPVDASALLGLLTTVVAAGVLLGAPIAGLTAMLCLLVGVASWWMMIPGIAALPMSGSVTFTTACHSFFVILVLLFGADESVDQASELSYSRESRVRESEERYALAARGANDGLWDWNLATNHVYYSPRWKSMLGCSTDEVGPDLDEWFGRIHPEDFDHFQRLLSAHLEGISSHFESELRMRHSDGGHRWLLTRGLAVRSADGKAIRIAGSVADITNQKRVERQLIEDAFHDALTGLPNRALFVDRLKHTLQRAQRSEDPCFAVLHVDLDRFKDISDSVGYRIADQLMIGVGRRLIDSLRAVDTVSRIGGDEFAILLEDIEEDKNASQAAVRILEDLAAPFTLDGQQVFVSASIGIISRPQGYDHVNDLMRDVEIALHRAKSEGKARHVIFESSMRIVAQGRLRLETDLRHALSNNELIVHYQPIVSLDTGKVMGFEALVRWQHPTRGLVPPNEFIPIAEETGLINPLGEWVLKEACRRLKTWHDQYSNARPLFVSVNVSSQQVKQRNLVQQVEDALTRSSLPASCLKVEITESVIIENVETTRATFEKLRRLGIEIYMDDFGTGYSSLSYLHSFPIDNLKIDRAFIRRLGNDRSSTAIVEAIVALAHSLRIPVVAEGVETHDQVRMLQLLKCDKVQGFLFAKPMDHDAIVSLLASLDGGVEPILQV